MGRAAAGRSRSGGGERRAWHAGCEHRSLQRRAADALRSWTGLRAVGLTAARPALLARAARRRRALLSAAPQAGAARS